jgi:DNA repair protein RadC
MEKELFSIKEMEIVYVPNSKKFTEQKITSSQSAHLIFRELFNPNTINFQEECIVLYLNNYNKVLGTQKLSKGGLTATVVDARIIFATALKSLATGIILAHNHPSGNLSPSNSDKELTRKLSEGAKLLDLKLLDHLILAPNEHYYSFSDEDFL